VASSRLLYVGTHVNGEARGIYVARLDDATGALSAPALAAATGQPTFLALSPDRKFLYAVCDREAMAAGFAIGPAGRLTALPAAPGAKAPAPSHIAVDRTGRALFLANYHAASVATIPLRPDGTCGPPQVIAHTGHGPDPVRQAAPHPHSVNLSPDNRFALACDLGLDRIFTYRFDAARARLAPAAPPFVSTAPGSGPRHLEFSADGRRAYCVNEIDNTVVACGYEAATGALSPRAAVSTLPAGFAGTNTAAEIALHPNGKFLYASNRGHDSIAGFAISPETGELSPLDFTPCGGRGPRHFAFSPNPNWLVCAHQDSNTLASFRVSADTGRLVQVGPTVAAPAPVCVLFYD
jgi:6-phosphogluconolactonase